MFLLKPPLWWYWSGFNWVSVNGVISRPPVDWKSQTKPLHRGPCISKRILTLKIPHAGGVLKQTHIGYEEKKQPSLFWINLRITRREWGSGMVMGIFEWLHNGPLRYAFFKVPPREPSGNKVCQGRRRRRALLSLSISMKTLQTLLFLLPSLWFPPPAGR